MQKVTQDAVTADEGETAFILQLRPAFPPTADPDALSSQIDQFVSLYLSASGLSEARFAPLELLTWAISAPKALADKIDDLRADLAETLFGTADGDHIRLVRQDMDIDEAEGETAPAADPEPVDDPFSGWEPANSSAATRAAMDGASDVLELDVADLDIVDSDVFDVDAWSQKSSTDLLDSAFEPEDAPEADDSSDPAEPSFDTLTEAPDRSGQNINDIAAELAAFRREMREIAAGIPGGSGSEALDQFRSEMDSITGALGQRVDGAAQRIESAADRVAETVARLPDAERMAGAVERAEASAEQMESSVREAVEALTAALTAMNASGPQEDTQAELGP